MTSLRRNQRFLARWALLFGLLVCLGLAYLFGRVHAADERLRLLEGRVEQIDRRQP